MKRSTLALVDSEEQARATVERLTSSGFSQDDISVLFADKSSTREFAHEKETKLPEGATIGARTGGTEELIPNAPVQDVLGPEGTTPITGSGISHLRETASGDNPQRVNPERTDDLSRRSL